jgi:hypothetical protein
VSEKALSPAKVMKKSGTTAKKLLFFYFSAHFSLNPKPSKALRAVQEV